MDNDSEVRRYVDSEKTQFWFHRGKLHRGNNLPAIITRRGARRWYVNGKLHNEYGPAILTAIGEVAWCLDGKHYKFNEYCDELNLCKEDKAMLRLQYD